MNQEMKNDMFRRLNLDELNDDYEIVPKKKVIQQVPKQEVEVKVPVKRVPVRAPPRMQPVIAPVAPQYSEPGTRRAYWETKAKAAGNTISYVTEAGTRKKKSISEIKAELGL